MSIFVIIKYQKILNNKECYGKIKLPMLQMLVIQCGKII